MTQGPELDARSVHNPNDRNYSHSEVAHLLTKSFEQLIGMNEVEFRARFRERLHHTMEIQLYDRIFKGKPLPPRQAETMKLYARAWRARGLSEEQPEFRHYLTLAELVRQVQAGQTPDLTPWDTGTPDDSERCALERVIAQRRSIRQWDWSRPVSDEVIDAILRAGLWAPHSCNLRSIRFLVIREENAPGLFRGSNIPTGPVHLVVMQDLRAYDANPPMPPRNQLLDCGAATQNMLLTAHAYGLGGVWITFADTVRDRLRERFALDGHICPVNFIDVGYPAPGITPCPPSRPNLEDVVLGRI